MSWSIGAIRGKKAAVAAAADQAFANVNCQEPEQSLKEQARALVAALVAAQPDGAAIVVEANGSAAMGAIYEDGGTVKVAGWRQTHQSLSVKVEPIWGFVE